MSGSSDDERDDERDEDYVPPAGSTATESKTASLSKKEFKKKQSECKHGKVILGAPRALMHGPNGVLIVGHIRVGKRNLKTGRVAHDGKH